MCFHSYDIIVKEYIETADQSFPGALGWSEVAGEKGLTANNPQGIFDGDKMVNS